MDLKLKIWRQKDPRTRGKFVNYKLRDISSDSSFLEMLDVLNEQLVAINEEPVVFFPQPYRIRHILKKKNTDLKDFVKQSERKERRTYL